MLALAAPVPFKQVIGYLRTKQLPTLREILNRLESYRKRARAGVILFELDPDKFKHAARKEVVTDEWAEDPIIEACLETINNIAPLDLELMSMRFEDGEYIDNLYPAACGYPLGWDEWEEMVDNLDTCSDEIGLYVLVTAMRLGDVSVLFKASERFGWELGVEDGYIILDPNWERLFEMLEERGLGVFKNAINVCLYSTENPYFDYNPWDEEVIAYLPAFSVAGVRALEEAWAEAQPIREDLTRAVIQFARDMSLAGTLYELYVESVAETEPRPQTLAELWAGDDEAGEPVIDEFYGPIG